MPLAGSSQHPFSGARQGDPVTKRGAGWLVDNLNGVVALACVRQNEWWEELWSFVRNRRQQRRVATAA